MKLETFLAINAPAAVAASKALSRLTGRPAVVKLLDGKLIEPAVKHPALGREQLVIGIHLSIHGRLQGAALLCFPEPKAFELSRLLVVKPRGARRLTELDESALKELGNIICGNYVTALANKLRAKVLPGLPRLTRGRFGVIFEQLIARQSLDEPISLLINVEIDLPAGAMMGHMLLCLKTGALIDA